MAKNYSITFVSLRTATTYTVNIGGGTGTAVPLKGGAQPFTTEEDGDEDMFTPIRTQSGYIRIVDDGKDANGNVIDANLGKNWWKDLIPATDTSRPVTLILGGTALWVGFIQAQDFSGTLFGGTQEREFPVQCALSVTRCVNVDYSQTQIQNFAYLLKQIADSIPSSQRPQQFYIQGGSNAQAWLLKKIDWQNFVAEDSDGNYMARYNMFDCLEDMCRFWGWTARMKGPNLYLTCADDASQTTCLSLSYNQLTTMAGGTSAGSSITMFSTVTLSGDIFASFDNEDMLIRGLNRCEVKTDINKAKNLVKYAPESVHNQMLNLSYNRYYAGDNDEWRYISTDLLSFTDKEMTGECLNHYASFNIEERYQGSVIFHKKKNWTDEICIYKSYDSTKTAVSLVVPRSHNYYNGKFILSGKIYRGFYELEREDDFVYHVYMRIGVGHTRSSALWWSGSSWSSGVKSFKANVGDGLGFMSYAYFGNIQNRTSWSGIEIPVNTGLSGNLYIEILGSDDIPEDNDDQRSFQITDFALDFERQDGDDKTKDVIYTATNGSPFVNKTNIYLIYASDTGTSFGYGLVLNEDGSYLSTLTYGNASLHPEQYLANRVANFGANARRMMKVDLRADFNLSSEIIRDISPRHKIIIDDTTCYPISISQNWRDDITTLILLEI